MESQAEPPTKASPRFEIELDFVSCLANPSYLQYLSVTYPNLFIQQETTSATKNSDDNSDATCFVRYLKYLLEYWRKPEYIQYLTHPAATIRNLELLQIEQFRKDIVRPDIIAKLTEGFAGVGEYVPPSADEAVVEGDINATGENAEPANGENGTASAGT